MSILWTRYVRHRCYPIANDTLAGWFKLCAVWKHSTPRVVQFLTFWIEVSQRWMHFALLICILCMMNYVCSVYSAHHFGLAGLVKVCMHVRGTFNFLRFEEKKKVLYFYFEDSHEITMIVFFFFYADLWLTQPRVTYCICMSCSSIGARHITLIYWLCIWKRRIMPRWKWTPRDVSFCVFRCEGQSRVRGQVYGGLWLFYWSFSVSLSLRD